MHLNMKRMQESWSCRRGFAYLNESCTDDGASSKQVKELEFVTKRYDENLGEPLRAVKEDVEKEWAGKVGELEEQLRTNKTYALECERALDKERQVSLSLFLVAHTLPDLFCSTQIRKKLEEEKRALVAFVTDLDSALPSLRGHAQR